MHEVIKHNKEDDCWVIINGQVYDLTEFLHEHPGGKRVIMEHAGKDATEEFQMFHKNNVIMMHLKDDQCLGNVIGVSLISKI